MVKHITIHLTQKCNLSCKYCHTAAGPHVKDKEEFSSVILRNLFADPITSISLAGGEPFSVKNKLYSFLEQIPLTTQNIAITTNGLLINNDDLLRLKLRNVRLQFSLDGLSSSHNKNRGDGTYDHIICNMTAAIKSDIRVDVLTTVTKSNINKIGPFLKEIDKMGIQNITLLHFTPKGRGSYQSCEEIETEDWIKYCWHEIKSFVTESVRVWIQPRFITKKLLYQLDSNRRITLCNHYKYDFAYIDIEQGDIYPCGLAYNTPLRIGKLQNGTLNQVIIDNIKSTQSFPEECDGCELSNECGGGAKCYSYLYYNCAERRDPKCDVDKDIIPVCPFPAMYVSGPELDTNKPTII